MPEIVRLGGSKDSTYLVEGERTPERVIKLGIRMHVAKLSLFNTIYVSDKSGIRCSRKAVRD